jgi:threonine/homoserine/homoserine lactone efflux protein
VSEYIFLVPIILAFIAGVMSPGPSFFLIAHNAMSNTRKKALFMAFGLGLGAAILTLVACTGLYLLLTKIPIMFLAFKVLGGAYLCFLAYKIFKSSKSKQENNSLHVDKKADNFKSFLTGLFTQLSNPKTIIVIGGIIAAFLPQETPRYTFVIICTLSFILDFSWYSTVAIALSTKKAQNAYLKYKSIINLISSTFIALIGIKLVAI